MNKCIFTGNLCKDNDIRVMQNTNKKVLRNSIAVKRNFKNANGEYDSDFINIVVFEPSSKFMESYTGKGDKVAITGRWQHRTYTDNNNNTKYVDECVVDSVELLAKPKNSTPTQQSAPQQEPTPVNDNPWFNDDDLPF